MSFTSDNPIQVNQLPISVDYDVKDEIQLKWLLEQGYKRNVNAINTKIAGLYWPIELGNFKQWYTKLTPTTYDTTKNRNVYRFLFDLVALNGGNIGAGATVTFAHGIANLTNTAVIYASCTSTIPEFFSVMYPNVRLTATNVVFTNPSASPLTQADVIAEYMKNN